jgi:hypothetical protein
MLENCADLAEKKTVQPSSLAPAARLGRLVIYLKARDIKTSTQQSEQGAHNPAPDPNRAT